MSRSVRQKVVIGVVAGLLVIAAAVTVAFGGLRQRSSQTVVVPYGQQIDSGMMVYQPLSATVVHHIGDTYSSPWEVWLLMKVRNPQLESLAPLDLSRLTVFGVDPSTRLTAQPRSYSLTWTNPEQSAYATGSRWVVPPESDWMYLRLRLYLDDTYQPSDTFLAAIRLMEFKATNFYDDSGQKGWAPNTFARAFTVSVPLTQLPDD